MKTPSSPYRGFQTSPSTTPPTGSETPPKITVTFVPEVGLRGGVDSIQLQFEDDVKFPAIMTSSQVTISSTDVVDNSAVAETPTPTETRQGNTAHPAGVIIDYTGSPADEPRVTLDIGDMNPSTAMDAGGFQGIQGGSTVTVVFQQSAGITNPTEAGDWEVKASTKNIGGTSESKGSGDFTFRRVVALSGSSGTRGGTVTVTGKGFRKDLTAVVWVEDLGDTTPDMKTGAETELCSATVEKDSTFECKFVVNASNFTAGKNRTINASDGRSQEAYTKPSWKLLGKVTAVPDSAAIGDTVSLEFVDFPPGNIDELTLGGVDLLYHEDDNPDGIRDFSPSTTSSVALVIPDNVPLGLQSLDAASVDKTVTPNIKSGTRRDTLTIQGAQVTATPSTVVPTSR